MINNDKWKDKKIKRKKKCIDERERQRGNEKQKKTALVRKAE